MKPEELAARLGPEVVGAIKQRLMTRIVLTVLGNVQQSTAVRTGTLRRSWTTRVEGTGERGIVGTNVVYARYQKNAPLEEGLDASRERIEQLLQEAGEELWRKVAGG